MVGTGAGPSAGSGVGPGAGPAGSGRDGDVREQVVSLYVKHKKLYPRAVSGWFATWRWALVWATQLVFYGLPWLEWNARQAVLFDLEARRFYIFGLVLYPQDFIYLTGLLLVSAYSLFLFTAVAGRLWCGYACPQTVYTEIFMWVERRLEGDRVARMKLDAAPWSLDKLLRKGGKQLAWVAMGLWTGFTFVGYFTPVRTLGGSVASLGLGPWETFWILFYGLATYGNAGWMREQVCKYMCPYARFQSAMFDRDTLVISYDAERGEPRGKKTPKGRGAELGHCVDCGLCVQVCPTGIDIRKGLQYECIGCAACVDACNGVMDRVKFPRGLIRYDTQDGMQRHLNRGQELARVLRPRVLIYTSILGLIVLGLGLAIALRSPFKVDVVRDRGALARIVDEGQIENVYRLQVMNATEQTQRYRITVAGLGGLRLDSPVPVTVEPAAARWVPVAARVPPQAAAAAGPGSHRIEFLIERLDPGSPNDPGAPAVGRVLVEKSTFIVPR
ncbi:MAG: cytochrome c oxidase accessory protein CcoG [Rubrivivax sp.]|nr:cytochrome c oxidase accessory protein CcoG [Rubrivivax sp.]